jgi:four helix bundle protein
MPDNEVKPFDLKVRTKEFALQVIRMYSHLPKSTEAQILGRQVLRSGTSIGAQYREAQQAKSDADLISKIEGVLQELDETGYWFELLEEANLAPSDCIKPLSAERDELTAIFISIVKKIKARRQN